MSAMTDRLAPFAALEGVLFVERSMKQPLYFVCGRYGNGHGAIRIFSCLDVEECQLTVNLVDEDLGLGEFFARVDPLVPLYGIGGKCPIFERTGRKASSGFVTNYAEVWRFAPCAHADHGCSAPFAVQCSRCKAEWEHLYQQGVQNIIARDTVRRLSGKDYWPE